MHESPFHFPCQAYGLSTDPPARRKPSEICHQPRWSGHSMRYNLIAFVRELV